MKIRNITINSFGKLSNYSLDLNEGVNVVYGPNEYGKTTIMEFIKLMFYGKNEKTAIDKFIREKYKPWDGSEMSGSIVFEHDGQIYKIQKEISEKSAGKDKTVIQNMSVGEVIKLGKDEEAGEHFFGIDVKSFERSSYIKNLGATDFEKPKSSKSAKDTLSDKMFSNLLETGDEDVSQSGVVSKIKAAMAELRTPTGRSGRIAKTNNEISDLKLKINDLNNFEKSQENVKKELEKLSAFIKEQKNLENQIKKFDECRRIGETKKLLEMVREKEKICKEAMKFGVNLDAAENIFNELEKYKKDLSDINLKIESMTKFAENHGKKFLKISDEEKNRFEDMIKHFECEKEKSKILKYLTEENLLSYDARNFDFPNGLKDMALKIKNSEQIKASKIFELENVKSKLANINMKFLFADGLFLVCLIICVFTNILSFFPLVLGGLLSASAIHLYYFSKTKKTVKALENEIFEKNSEIENLKSSFNLKTERIKIGNENNLKNIENEIKGLLAEKICADKNEFYQNYAKSQEAENFGAALKDSENKRSKILSDLKSFLDSNGIKISVDKFYETFDFLRGLSSKYIGIGSEIRYKASAMNLKKADSRSLESILNANSFQEPSFEISDIDTIRMRFAELEKMNLHGAYIDMQKKVINTSEDPEKLKLYLEKLILKKQQMEEYYDCLKITLDAFDEASDELRKSFNPKLNGRASEIFKKLTGDKYENVYIQKNYDFVVGGKTMDRYSNYFSSGTIDQAYLAVRIAISELISNAKIPLIFDDTLMQYDDERLKNTINFLKNYAESNSIQSIIFTCHDYLKNIIQSA